MMKSQHLLVGLLICVFALVFVLYITSDNADTSNNQNDQAPKQSTPAKTPTGSGSNPKAGVIGVNSPQTTYGQLAPATRKLVTATKGLSDSTNSNKAILILGGDEKSTSNLLDAQPNVNNGYLLSYKDPQDNELSYYHCPTKFWQQGDKEDDKNYKCISALQIEKAIRASKSLNALVLSLSYNQLTDDNQQVIDNVVEVLDNIFGGDFAESSFRGYKYIGTIFLLCTDVPSDVDHEQLLAKVEEKIGHAKDKKKTATDSQQKALERRIKFLSAIKKKEITCSIWSSKSNKADTLNKIKSCSLIKTSDFGFAGSNSSHKDILERFEDAAYANNRLKSKITAYQNEQNEEQAKENEIKQCKDKRDSLSMSLSSRKSLENRKKEVEKAIVALEGEIFNLQEEDAKTAAQSKKEALGKEKESIETKISTNEKALKQVKGDIEKKKKELQVQERQETKDELTALNEKESNLQKELNKQKRELNGLQAKIDEQEKKITAIEQDIERNKEAEQEKEELEKELNNIKEYLTDLIERQTKEEEEKIIKAGIARCCREIKCQTNRLNQDRKILAEKGQEDNKVTARRQKSVTSLTEARTTSEEERDDLKAKLTSIQERLKELTTKQGDREQEFKNEVKSIDKKERELQHLKDKLSAKQEAYDQAVKESKNMEHFFEIMKACNSDSFIGELRSDSALSKFYNNGGRSSGF